MTELFVILLYHFVHFVLILSLSRVYALFITLQFDLCTSMIPLHVGHLVTFAMPDDIDPE